MLVLAVAAGIAYYFLKKDGGGTGGCTKLGLPGISMPGVSCHKCGKNSVRCKLDLGFKTVVTKCTSIEKLCSEKNMAQYCHCKPCGSGQSKLCAGDFCTQCGTD